MQYGFCLHVILSRNSILHSGQGNGFPRKSCASHVTLCGGWPFKAVPPCDPIHQVTRKTRTEQRAIPGLALDLFLDHWPVLYLANLFWSDPAARAEMRFRRMHRGFSLLLRIGACQSRHPHLKMGELL